MQEGWEKREESNVEGNEWEPWWGSVLAMFKVEPQLS